MAGGVLDPQFRVTLDGKGDLRDISFEENYSIDEKAEQFVRLSNVTGNKQIGYSFSGNPIHCIIMQCEDNPDIEFTVTFRKTGGDVALKFQKVFVLFPSQTFLADLTKIEVAAASVEEVVLKTLLFNLLPSV